MDTFDTRLVFVLNLIKKYINPSLSGWWSSLCLISELSKYGYQINMNTYNML